MMTQWMIGLVMVVACVTAGRLAAAQEIGGAAGDGQRSEGRYGPGPGGAGNSVPPWGWRGGGSGGRIGGERWIPDEVEWNELSAFMKQHSPRRWEEYLKLPQKHRQQRNLQGVLVRRWRLMQWVRNADSELYELQKSRWRVEDEVFGLTRDLRTASSTTDSQLKQKLRERIGAMVDLRTRERNIRIARWEKQIAREREIMSREAVERDEIIRKRILAAERDAGHLGEEEPMDGATTQDGADEQAVDRGAPTTAPSPAK